MVVPKLRFPEFKNNWNTYLLSERVNEIIGGGTPSTKNKSYWNGNIPWFSSSDVQINKLFNPIPTRFISKEAVTNSATSIIPQDSISIVSRVGVGKLAFIQHDYCTSQDFQSLVGFKDRPIFLSYLLQKELIKLSMMTQGTSIKGITKVELANLKINVPSISEQNKIEKLLISLDKKIQLQQEKIDLLKEQKKGFMQKIFSQEFRFKDEIGQEFPSWEKQNLSSFSERVTRKNSELLTTRPLTISAQYGLIDQTEFFNKTVASVNLTGYYLLQKGEFAYNKSYSNGYPLGAIKRLDAYENGALSTLYICFSIKENVNSDFLVHYFDSSQWHQEVALICVEGARNHGLLNVSVGEFFETQHNLPCLEEQKKIAEFLNKINKKIELNEQTLMNLQQQKQAFMQQMFI